MKIFSFVRICLGAMLLVGIIVTWVAAMPNHMDQRRLAMIGGDLPCCIAKAYTFEGNPCSDYGDCTTWHTFAYGTDFTSERTVAFKNTGNCLGDPECNWIVKSTYHFDCYLN